jgi:tRNA pseudouridine(55) synthase
MNTSMYTSMNTFMYLCNKPIGMTPAECCKRLKEKLGGRAKVGFTCRLDPMAYGLLPIIVDGTSDTYNKFNGCDKVYTFKLILGYSTTSYDILGIPTIIKDQPPFDLDIIRALEEDTYPIYSSKSVTDPSTGKKVCLWKLAKDGKVPDELPKRKIKVYDIQVLKEKYQSPNKLLEKIERYISLLSPGHIFETDAIISGWKEVLGGSSFEIKIVSLSAKVSSGTYIRSLGNKLGGVCYDICRVHAGDLSIDTKKYQLEFTAI